MSGAADTLLDRLGRLVAGRLRSETSGYKPYTPSDFSSLCAALRPGDVLLVEGNEKISTAIKYLTQSTWSHAALFVGDRLSQTGVGPARARLVEVNLGEGCVAVPLSKYETFNTRICRAKGLSRSDREAVVEFMVARLGTKYDLRNIFDMIRYFVPTPPVPVRWRRRMIAFGSGDPTRAICSSLIAQAFQSIRYPILPELSDTDAGQTSFGRKEIFHIRHHSLFTPRDFDLSPFFEIVKPRIRRGFDHRGLSWDDEASEDQAWPADETAP
jgi:hypothetical protein